VLKLFSTGISVVFFSVSVCVCVSVSVQCNNKYVLYGRYKSGKVSFSDLADDYIKPD
jgi:hypothetical protein